MAHKMHLWISEMDYTRSGGFLELLNVDYLPPTFTLNQADGEFLCESHLVFRSDTINLSLEQIYNLVRISDTPGGGFNLSIE